VKVVIDTHALLWLLVGSDRLGSKAVAIIESNDVLVSELSIMEIGIKESVGKLPIGTTKRVGAALEELRFERKALGQAQAEFLAELPLHHRDPFDRGIVALAASIGAPIMTADRAFGAYDVRLIDARE
jgi:PIN domain nuclease of toxin-antitoxin system